MNKQQIGSMTAKGGFLNEEVICTKFNNYKKDKEAKVWLKIMGYEPSKVQSLKAVNIPPRINKGLAISLGVTADKYEETVRFKKADLQI